MGIGPSITSFAGYIYVPSALSLIWVILILAFIFILYSVYVGDDSRYAVTDRGKINESCKQDRI